MKIKTVLQQEDQGDMSSILKEGKIKKFIRPKNYFPKLSLNLSKALILKMRMINFLRFKMPID